MAQALMYWEHQNYLQVEKQLKRVFEQLSDQPSWRINMAHTLFMLEKYAEAAKFYETVVRDDETDLLKVSAAIPKKYGQLRKTCSAHRCNDVLQMRFFGFKTDY